MNAVSATQRPDDEADDSVPDDEVDDSVPDDEVDVSANFGGGGRALSIMRVMILYLTMR